MPLAAKGGYAADCLVTTGLPHASAWNTLFGITRPAFAPASDGLEWLQVETRYTVIRYESFEDLIKFVQKINYAKEAWGLTRLFEKTQIDVVSDKDKLFIEVAEKVDKLWERVREILDMLCKTAAVKPVIEVDPEKFRPTDSSPLLDITRLENDTGWKSGIDFSQTLQDIMEEVVIG